MERWKALDQMFREGVPRYVSFSPTYPTMDAKDIERALQWFSAINPDVVFHEPINPRGKNFDMCVEALRKEGLQGAAQEFERITNPDEWVAYALKQIDLVQQKSAEFGSLVVHTWPDNQLIDAVEGELKKQLIDMKRSVSPEVIGRDWEENSKPDCQAPLKRISSSDSSME
jgi:DNA repair photolyase